jgi:tetratricopeptide (TPR) repeat protein
MSETRQIREVGEFNERSLKTLARSIQFAQGQFTLILARCNYTSLRSYTVQRLRRNSPIPIQEITLPDAAKTLFTVIQAALRQQQQEEASATPAAQPAALMVFGLESVELLDQLLISTNQVREEFRKRFQFPLVLWVNDRVLQKLIRLAPDFRTWASVSIQFEMEVQELVLALQDHANRVFTDILEAGDEQFLPNGSLAQGTNFLRQAELEFALNDIAASGHVVEPQLQASLDFLLGREAHAQVEMEAALARYDRSLDFWQMATEQQRSQPLAARFTLLPSAAERAACIAVHLGLWWRSYAVLQRTTYLDSCRRAEGYFRQGTEIFEQENLQRLVANFIIPQAEILQKLGEWQQLEAVAKKALVLHKLFRDCVRQARDHGFLAEVALNRADWTEAKQETEAALQLLVEVEQQIARQDVANPHLESSLELAKRYHRSGYLLLLARAKAKLGDIDGAIADLEAAKQQTYPQDDPQLYIQILRALRDFYFDKGRYREAFRTRQLRRSIEQQYGFRAFVGALRLEPQRYLLNPPPEDETAETLLAEEIKASGRQQDVHQLLSRFSRNDYKLTVIHGASGVGKSSIVNAGLLPALKERTIGERTAQAIVISAYGDWQTTLEKSFTAITQADVSEPDDATRSTTESVNLLLLIRAATQQNFLPILIFDQFEEFFFVYAKIAQRRPFYDFLRDCLNEPFVKVILVLREDYLHHLLEFQRSTDLDIINNDILGKEIRYSLENFSPAAAESVIKSLTNQAQFYLEDDLVKELVRDLAGELGTVSPIELQVVGAELQAEEITTLAAYHKKGPKEKLAARSLETIVKDCGKENEQIARIVLFMLTHENGSRPFKTRTELEMELITIGKKIDADQLDLVLEVLTGSGLIFLIPEVPNDRYQLAHDYLVDFIRNQTIDASQDVIDRSFDWLDQLRENSDRLRRENENLLNSIKHLRTNKRQLEILNLCLLVGVFLLIGFIIFTMVANRI